MRRSAMILALLVMATIVAAVAVAAVNLHNPAEKNNGLTLTVTGTLTGLGMESTTITVTATGSPTATCTNHGHHQPPGQNPATVTITGSVNLAPNAFDKNGNLPFSVTTIDPFAPSDTIPSNSTQFSCPSANWTENVNHISFTGVTLNVYQPAVGQPGSTLVLTTSLPNAP